MIDTMTKVRLASPRTLLNQVTASLQEAGVLHIESSPTEAAQIPLHPRVMDESTAERQAAWESLRNELSRLLLLLPELPANHPCASTQTAQPIFSEAETKRLTHHVTQVGKRITHLTGQLKTCEDELALLSKYEQGLRALAPFLRCIQESQELDHLGVTITKGDMGDSSVPMLREMMAAITKDRYELFQANIDDHAQAILLIFPKVYSVRIRELLWEVGINELQLPASVSDKPLTQAVRIILKKKTDLPLHIQRLQVTLHTLSRTWRPDFTRYHTALIQQLAQIEAASLSYQTKMVSLIYGWVPRHQFHALAARLHSTFGEVVVIEACPIDRTEWATVPVILRNPGFLRPFELFTRLIALPQYGSIDPTPFLGIFFPLFYGMILGDVGYGLLLAVSAVVVRRQFGHVPLVRDLTIILMIASGTAVFFGFLYGELFGELGERIGLHPTFNRMESFLSLLYLSIGIGAIHVMLAITLGALWAWREGEWKACLTKLGGFLLVLSSVGSLASMTGWISPEWTLYGEGGVLLSLVIIFGFGGIRGAMELHNVVNVLSYLRLMGLGIASAALAFAANKLGGMAGNVFLAIIIGGIFHTINLIFGLFSPTIQSLRLHYVEFFENFFAPGGRPYTPFQTRHE